MITGIFPTLCADDVAAARDFYVDLFGFDVVFDSGWYVQLQAPSEPHPQIGVVHREHDSVPAAFRRRPSGVLVGIEVDDVDAVCAKIVAAGRELVMELRDEPWGQRHFMVADPTGTLVDVITPTPPDSSYADAYGA